MLQHVALEVRAADVERCVAFWALLGFRRVEPPASLAGETTWVQRDGTQIHLLHTEQPTVPAGGHAAVVVEDYAQALSRLGAHGFSADPRCQHWQAPRAFLRDPAGHRVEIMAAPPAEGSSA